MWYVFSWEAPPTPEMVCLLEADRCHGNGRGGPSGSGIYTSFADPSSKCKHSEKTLLCPNSVLGKRRQLANRYVLISKRISNPTFSNK